ncbi:MAG: hypothetical protein INR69_09705 [Mucilaginibacter polytrichastri]|nr:hypothetical protein [Mucilaginibacter polytrichastri]
MENTDANQPKQNQGSLNKIYFLIAVIVALLGTNAYLYFQKNKSDKIIVYQSDEKTRLQTELDSLEAQLEQATASTSKLSDSLKAKDELYKSQIAELRQKLAKGELTADQLTKAKAEINSLRGTINKYSADIDQLKKENQALTVERDTLKSNLATVNQKATDLEAKNQELNTKVQAAAALKSGSITVTPLKVKNSGKEREVSRASTTKKIKIEFTIAPNAVAQPGMHTIYMRLLNPAGNQYASNDGGSFSSDNQELKYTYKTSIDYRSEKNSGYTLEWTNPGDFEKGQYSVILYADGYTMGTASFNLR